MQLAHFYRPEGTLSRLGERQANYLDAAIATQGDRAVGTDQMLAGDLLVACHFHKGDGNNRFLDVSIQRREDRSLRPFRRHIGDLHGTVGCAQVDHSTWLYGKSARNRRVGKRTGDVNRDQISGPKQLGALGNNMNRFDHQNVRRFDGIGREDDFGKLLGNIRRQ